MLNLSLTLLLAGSPIPSAGEPVAALVEAKQLLLKGDFAALTVLLETRQSAAAKDSEQGIRFAWTLNAFGINDPAIPALLARWAAAEPKSWAPSLAQSVNFWSQSTRARGAKWASQTTGAQFRSMEELQASSVSACRVVLSRNKGVCPCYVQLALIAKHVGPDPLLARAFTECPRDFLLHVETLYGLFPRWGGSHGEMRAFIRDARARGLSALRLRDLENYFAIDEGTLLEVDLQLDAAAVVFDKAVEKSPSARLLQERAALNRRRKDPVKTLADANSALVLSDGGWLLSAPKLSELLIDRAWALDKVGRKEDASRDVVLALEISPTDDDVKQWARYLRVQIPR